VSDGDSYRLADRDPNKPNEPDLSDTCVAAIGRQLERALPPDFIHDQYRQDKAGYYEFIAYEEPDGNRILKLRVCPAEPLRYQLVGYLADRERGHSQEVTYAEGDGDLEAFLREHLDGAIQGLREVGQEDITVPWPTRS
jgi:hypothetical protein